MQPDSLLADEHVRDYIIAIQYLFGQVWWMILGFLVLVLYRDLLHQVAAGIYWKMGRTYNEKDAVVVNGYFCSIVHIGFFYTEFTVYDHVSRPPGKGYSWLVSNDRLNKLDVWKKRPKHDEEIEEIQTIHKVTKIINT